MVVPPDPEDPMNTTTTTHTTPRPAPSQPFLTLHELADATAHGVPSFSPFCLKVHLALGVLGLPYARAHGPFPAHWKGLDATGQVPVLVIDQTPIGDSTAIVGRLRALAPDGLNRGFSAAAEGEALLLEEFADSELNGFLVAARWLDDDNWPRTRAAYFAGMPKPLTLVIPTMARRRVRQSLHARDVWRRGPAVCWQRLETLLDALDARAPNDGFWFGEQVSTGDIAIAAQLKSLQTALTPRQSAAVAQRRRLASWVDRVVGLARTRAAC